MIRYAIFFLAITAFRLDAQDKYWIYFSDKGSLHQSFAAKSYHAAESARQLGISQRALDRRAKLPGAQALDDLDLPLAPEYVKALRAQGITPVIESRWLNAVSARMTGEQYRRIGALPFVASIDRVHVYRIDSLALGSAHPALQRRSSSLMTTRFDYGSSLDQVQQINVPRLHDLNITGHGVIVGMLDSGFRWRTHEALENTTVLAEYDFIQGDSVTSNQAGDSSDQDEHGTKTLSVLGGFMPGQLIGPAFGASFVLGKTEYVPAELNIEEDYWVAGLEWEERNGVDIVSTSLGYSEFDPGQKSYTYQDMNGHTAVTTKAASVAARKGVLICVAMGNEASQPWHYLTAPADADSIVSVGAVDGSGFVTSFSSVGPTSDGRMKPEVCARGLSDVCAAPVSSGKSNYVTNSGTSLSTPLVAGVAAQLLSARPELTPMQLRDALRNTASNSTTPDNSIGWGVVDAYKALLYHGLLVSASFSVTLGADSARTISTVILSTATLVTDSLVYHYSVDGASSFTVGRMHSDTELDPATHSGTYSFVLPKEATHFYITARDERGDARSLPYRAPVVLYDAHLNSTGFPPVLPLSFVLDQNYPNPFNGSTTIRYALTQPSHVSLMVYDILGRVVEVLVNEDKAPGYYNVSWNPRSASSGVYFYTIRSVEFNDTKKMVLVR
jgi:serine protease AprX